MTFDAFATKCTQMRYPRSYRLRIILKYFRTRLRFYACSAYLRDLQRSDQNWRRGDNIFSIIISALLFRTVSQLERKSKIKKKEEIFKSYTKNILLLSQTICKASLCLKLYGCDSYILFHLKIIHRVSDIFSGEIKNSDESVNSAKKKKKKKKKEKITIYNCL